ncbi:uncharacterized protein LOC122046188 [Zingiber officinale]|uniref:C2H2-type domain-containing protein n=1 Tax=Zingiber officinale TaxID=94328 RepID=A0A8J5HMC4_ZINOF|nr:uncharacterized protein LOC122041664 [Zingiber officinale]XP_042462688.1 uncharacterized protein LOC122046188 [Zingiber officinale]KAG6528464.1 hypothetical protein ZIOFF_010639 [Zingiber officinale]
MGRAAVAIAFLFACLFFSLDVAGCLSHQDFIGAAGTRTLLQEDVKKHEVHCSRERSRIASKIIDQYLMPFVEQEQYHLPNKCRLHHDNDIFREQEEHKIHVDINEWRCGFCKKSFRAEKFLDLHFDNRHSNLLDDIQGRCLADLCGALHCDQMVESKKAKTKCNPAAAARNRHLCESLADNCFPTSQGHSASRLHEFFLRQFCDAHTCSQGKKPFSQGGKKQTSVFYLAVSILIVMLLPLFYVLVYLHQRGMKRGIQDLKRISKAGKKTKSY